MFYDDIERIKRLNNSLLNDDFHKERGYDNLKHAAMEQIELSLPVFSPESFLVDESGCFLDIGCGAGLDIAVAKQTSTKPFVVGVDMSEPLLRVGQKKCGNFFVLSQGNKLPFRDNSFDGVIMNGYFNIESDKQEVINQVGRVLKRGGFLYIADIFLKTSQIFIPEEGAFFNLKNALTLKEVFGLLSCGRFEYLKGHFEPGYTKEVGIFAVKWKKQ